MTIVNYIASGFLFLLLLSPFIIFIMTNVTLKNVSKRFTNSDTDAVSHVDLKIENIFELNLIEWEIPMKD